MGFGKSRLFLRIQRPADRARQSLHQRIPTFTSSLSAISRLFLYACQFILFVPRTWQFIYWYLYVQQHDAGCGSRNRMECKHCQDLRYMHQVTSDQPQLHRWMPRGWYISRISCSATGTFAELNRPWCTSHAAYRSGAAREVATLDRYVERHGTLP